MPIFELTNGGLSDVPTTDFQTSGIKERAHIQGALRDRIGCLGEELLIIAEEFGWWMGSSRRIDLLGVDTDANLVVVELKRDEDGGHMELQALRYAAMVSAMTFKQAVSTLARHRNSITPDEAAAETELTEFFGIDFEPTSFGQRTRIVLVASDFGLEVTTTVLWLQSYGGVDIRCVRFRPHLLDGKRLLVDVQTLIPPPGAPPTVMVGDKQRDIAADIAERHELRIAFLNALLVNAGGSSKPHLGHKPLANGVLWGAIGRSGCSINYVVAQHTSRVELLIFSEKAEDEFAQLKAVRHQIDQTFGGLLDWQEKDGIRQRRIFHAVQGGYRDPQPEWPGIHEKLIAAMLQLDLAVRPHVAKLM